MYIRVPVLMSVFLALSAFAQQATTTSRYGSPSGFGSVLYPGVGHAPQTRIPGSITDPGYASRVGASVRGYSGYSGVARGAAHPAHSRQVIVPVPIIVGGGYPYDPQQAYGYDQQAPVVVQQQQPAAAPPVVIINQAYRPEPPYQRDYYEQPQVRRYDTPVHPMPDPNDVDADAQPARRAKPVDDAKATIYLIAFKDHTILPALAYWVEGDTLSYITQRGTLNQASLTLIDRDFSRQLNGERQVEFSLP